MRRAARLAKGTEFDSVYEKGTVVRGPFFVLRIRENDLGHVRWGFAVGKRLRRRAVDRNRIRRRLREAARLAGIRGSADVILTAKEPVAAASFDELIRGIQKSARRAGLGVEPDKR